jgi:uncharacterized protein (TIGR02466 family)
MIEVYPLFSRPIMKQSINIDGLNFDNIKWGRNYNNSISQSQDVLEDVNFIHLKEECYKGLNEYFYNMMSVSNDVEIYITESWFNKTEKNETHHRHWHPNSLISGIVYLAGELEAGGDTTFITSQYNTLEFDVKEANLYNSKSWSLPPLNGEMLLFPSQVEHLVDTYTGETPRISLSFNTFVKGDINKQGLLRLSI